jgi:hypothetical protein
MIDSDAAEAKYLETPAAIRERCALMLELGRAGKLACFGLDEARLPEVAATVAALTRAAHADLGRIPYHSRWRHFAAGGIDRARMFEERLAGMDEREKLRRRTELVVLSVLLDAGAGSAWSYRGADGARYTRSEGLAVASFEWFMREGGLPSLAAIRSETLARAFQVSADNPLVGLEGRAALLRRLGEVVQSDTRHFAEGRLGQLGVLLGEQASGGAVPARAVLALVLAALGPIWPTRDVWPHPLLGRVPFHKLQQWLSYSLCETLELSGARVSELDELTGLAEYRNGGLFIDGGVLLPRGEALLDKAHAVSSQVVVEWRALTVALLELTAEQLRQKLGLSREQLPLARVLEGGTWAAGRALAFAKREDGAPPLRVESDGTVF